MSGRGTGRQGEIEGIMERERASRRGLLGQRQGEGVKERDRGSKRGSGPL